MLRWRAEGPRTHTDRKSRPFPSAPRSALRPTLRSTLYRDTITLPEQRWLATDMGLCARHRGWPVAGHCAPSIVKRSALPPSYPAPPCPALLRSASTCSALPQSALSCHALPYPTQLCPTPLCSALPYPDLTCPALPFPTLRCPALHRSVSHALILYKA